MQAQQFDILGAVFAEMRASLGEEVFSSATEKEIESRLRKAWGGQAVYVKKTNQDADARAEAIRSRYDMRNRLALQEEFGISRGQFYRILKGA
jgi:Mor family transcriptional regulator